MQKKNHNSKLSRSHYSKFDGELASIVMKYENEVSRRLYVTRNVELAEPEARAL